MAYTVSDETNRKKVNQMSNFDYNATPHHLQYNLRQLRQICVQCYQACAPECLKKRRNVRACKVSDVSILILLVLQAQLGMKSQRKFYRMCQLFMRSKGLERTRFFRRARYLIPLLKLIHQWMTRQFWHDDIAVIDSFPLPLCLPARNYRVKTLTGIADISYNPAKKMWFYGFKVHLLATLSGFIIHYVVTPASVHDSQVAEELLENCPCSYILADLGYLSESLKQEMAQKGYCFWTPLRQNMPNAKKHNHWKLLAQRRTIETRFSTLCAIFDIERPLARSLVGIELWLEQIIWAYNLRFLN